MSQITNAQRDLLARAAAAHDGTADLPEDAKISRPLIKKGLMISMPRADGPSRLILTAAGRVEVERQQPPTAPDDASQPPAGDAAAAPVIEPCAPHADHDDPAPRSEAATDPGGHREPEGAAPPTAAVRKGPPSGKLGQLAELLQRPKGATLDDMIAATGWQAHSVRGAMSGGLKKVFGYVIASDKTDGKRTYRITGQAQA
jgi:hypothetical protein